MKKFTTILLTAICICCAFVFTACGNNKIDMSTYFSPEVKGYVSGVKDPEKLTLETITGNKPYQTKKYIKYTITANNNWFYGMHVKTISFFIYSTITREVEFEIYLTGVENGLEYLEGSNTKDFLDSQHACFLKANQAVKITINVDDTIYLSTSNSILEIGIYDKHTEFNDGTFAYCIYGLSITGSHK